MTQAQLTTDFPPLAGVRHRFVDLPGLRMHVAEAGSGDPVLLLHGFPQHWWEWRKVIPGLAERHRVIAPDMRGAGWTDAPPTGYTRDQLRDDVVALLDALGLDRVRVVSHDMGALVAFGVCLEHPHRVEQHVSLGGPPPFISFSPRLLAAFPHLWFQPVLATPGIGPRALGRGRQRIARYLLTRFSPPSFVRSESEIEQFVARLRDPARARAGSALYRGLVLKEFQSMLSGAYNHQRLETPTLVLFGEADASLPPDLVRILLRNMGDHVDDVQIEFLDGAAHYIPEEQPEEVLERTLRFFS